MIKGQLLEGVTWYQGSSVRIRRGEVDLYVDPHGVDGVGAPDPNPASVILLTHPHYDNFSEEDLVRLRGPETIVIAPASMKKHVSEADHLVRPGDLLHLGEIEVLAMPAYNVDRRYHPAENGWLGYVFSFGGVTYYHAGDTDLIDAIRSVRCDVAFLPVDGQYTMDAAQAAEAARACEAEVVVPIRWSEGTSAAEADKLASTDGLTVALLEQAL